MVGIYFFHSGIPGIYLFGMILLVALLFYFGVVKKPDSIETQLGMKLSVRPEAIKLFESRNFGRYQMVAFEYDANRYGLAKLTLSPSQGVEWVKTTDQMEERALGVWSCPVRLDGVPLCTFLSVNPDLRSVLWVQGGRKTTYTMDHAPAVIHVLQDESTPGECSLLDKWGAELPQ